MPPLKFETGNPALLMQHDIDPLTRQRELLRTPKALYYATGTLIDKYSTSQVLPSGDTLFSTPTIQLHVDDDTQITVFADRHSHDYGRCEIKLIDQDQGTSVPLIVFNGPVEQTTDGNGSPITDPIGLQQVRDIIDAMDEQYHQALIKATDGFDIHSHVLKQLDDAIVAAEARLPLLRQRRAEMANISAPFGTYEVVIESAWASADEKPYSETIPAESLSAAMKIATDRFKQVNNRSDVQASDVRVKATPDGQAYYTVPREVIMPLFQAYSKSDYDAIELE